MNGIDFVQGPVYQHGLTFSEQGYSNYIHYKVWCAIIYSFPTVEVWEWISNFILHFAGYVIHYPCWDQSYTMLVKGAHGVQMLLSDHVCFTHNFLRCKNY